MSGDPRGVMGNPDAPRIGGRCGEAKSGGPTLGKRDRGFGSGAASSHRTVATFLVIP